MKVKVESIKNWSNESITPVAWKRIVIKVLPQLKELGYTLAELDNPTADAVVNGEAFTILNAACLEIYSVDIPMEELVVVV